MKVYIAARYMGDQNKAEVEELCSVVRAAGMEDYCFIRDAENYQKTFDDVKDLWVAARQAIVDCDAFLIDVTDKPTGGRVVEAGIAYALGKPIFVLVQQGVEYKSFYEGIATAVITYEKLAEVVGNLAKLKA